MKPKRYPYSFDGVRNKMGILNADNYTRLVIETECGTQKIAEITLDDATPADGFVIRLTPKYD